MKESIITPYMQRKIQREEAIYDDYCAMMKQPGAMSTAVTAQIVKKYSLASPTTLWRIRKRVEKRRAEQKEQEGK